MRTYLSTNRQTDWEVICNIFCYLQNSCNSTVLFYPTWMWLSCVFACINMIHIFCNHNLVYLSIVKSLLSFQIPRCSLAKCFLQISWLQCGVCHFCFFFFPGFDASSSASSSLLNLENQIRHLHMSVVSKRNKNVEVLQQAAEVGCELISLPMTLNSDRKCCLLDSVYGFFPFSRFNSRGRLNCLCLFIELHWSHLAEL